MADLDAPAEQLRDAALGLGQNERGGRVEGYLTTPAAAAGRGGLAAAGFDVEGHTLPPGSGLFFEPVNAVLTGDPLQPGGAAPGTVWAVLAAAGLPLPTPESLYRHVAATMTSVEWGSVATTVPDENVPSVLPLRQ